DRFPRRKRDTSRGDDLLRFLIREPAFRPDDDSDILSGITVLRSFTIATLLCAVSPQHIFYSDPSFVLIREEYHIEILQLIDHLPQLHRPGDLRYHSAPALFDSFISHLLPPLYLLFKIPFIGH